jgi:hypothetical protein
MAEENWNIRIVTVFGHRGGRSLSGDFSISVPSSMTVKEFLDRVAGSEENQQSMHRIVYFY